MPFVLAGRPGVPADTGAAAAQMGGQRRAGWLRTPAGGVTALILVTLALRLVFASALGLGMDESYMVAAGRHLHLSYFDHPPLAWWMAWAAAHLLGTDAPWAVRLPFVVTFALSTWLMFRLTERLFGAHAGLWAAALMNASPVFGVTAASWVLPDGPLLAALLGAALCLTRALDAHDDAAAWRWWAGTGLCAGLALLAKYSAAFVIAGALLYLVTTGRGRAWLRRPMPWLAGLLAVAAFLPVLVWNARHHWASFAFQGGRAAGTHLRLAGPLTSLAGEALFVLPWIWLPLMICALAALRRGPAEPRGWLLVCLGLPTVALFTVVSLWTRVLFHWAAPGYLMLFPLLGLLVARVWRDSRPVRVLLAATALLVSTGVLVVASEVHYNWLPLVLGHFGPDRNPDLDAVDWTSVRADLARRGLLNRPGLVVAATRWFDAGKLDYALGGTPPVICLGNDPREYGLTAPLADYAGADALIAAPRMTLDQVAAMYGDMFDWIEPLPPVELRHAGRPAMSIPLFLGHRLHTAAAFSDRGSGSGTRRPPA